MLISLKRFLDKAGAEPAHSQDTLQAALQMGRLLLESIGTQSVRGRSSDLRTLNRTVKDLLGKMDEPPSSMSLLEISGQALEAMETYSQRTTDYFREQTQEFQSMIAMLTETLTAVSEHCDDSVERLKQVERQIERASAVDDVRPLTERLGECLVSLREAASQQKKYAAETIQRLEQQIASARSHVAAASSPAAPGNGEIDLLTDVQEEGRAARPYVAVVKLHRADHIADRFGESAKHRMLALIGQNLKSIVGPQDRLLRWKGTSFVMFLNRQTGLNQVRSELSQVVSKTSTHYIELGNKSVLLSLVVDWVVFPQDQFPSLDAVFAEVDAFLASEELISSAKDRVGTQR